MLESYSMENIHNKKTSYKASGVDIDTADSIVKDIKKISKKTDRPGNIDSIGSFAGLFDLKEAGFIDPIIVTSTDGVGTKILIASDLNKFDTLGIDLVAMCVNDLIVQGAAPLVFLDYIATWKLDKKMILSIVQGIVEGCKISGCSLSGGETAELPGLYSNKKFDLAGFALGAVERKKIITQDKVKKNDIIFGLPSSGFHSNGYSLIRKILKDNNISYSTKFDFTTNNIGEELLTPTIIYSKIFQELTNKININGIANITGGGLIENIPRVLPEGKSALIDLKSWIKPEIFSWIKKIGDISREEMLRTFNCGIGMVFIVSEENSQEAINCLTNMNESFFILGKIIDEKNTSSVYFNN